MIRILNKYSFLVACFFVSFVMMADIPPPNGLECCKDYEPEGTDPPSQQYLDCIEAETEEPGSYCNPIVSIDNSIYVLITGLGGGVLALLVVYRGIKRKKTPM
ncbi:hypothetical protein ABS764_03245 [Flavobacterium sp. ST-87]|uniref:Cobalt/nickel transport protein n=1 Tax=Flavobacterium plantiphilum TaxID=3163297 RepID=A0ABW8XQP3_9FLAO